MIEALTLLFIFSLIMVTFYSVISIGTRYIHDSKNRLSALAIANERMEIVRNLSYDNVGTIGGGSVEGNIPEDQDIMENGRSYHVNTLVSYVDDSFDGNYPADAIPGDYKRVIINVSWENGGLGNNEVRLESRFVPPGLEVLNPGDGILSINVFSDQPEGTGVANSTVHIVNSETGLDTYQETDSVGNIVLIGNNIQDSIYGYEITVAKDGYETIGTLPPYPDTPYNPTFVHASVASGSVNVANIIQNKLSDLAIRTVGYQDQPVGDIDFHLTGGKKIGIEVNFPNDDVYNLDVDENTDSNGEKDFSDISPGQFWFSLAVAETGYEIIKTDPDVPYEIASDDAIAYPFSLYSETPLTFKVKLADKNVTSFLVSVLKNSDDSPIAGASVQLTNGAGYDATVTSAANGKAFFPTTADPFLSGTYDLKVTADGFIESNSSVTVSESVLKLETIKLDAL